MTTPPTSVDSQAGSAAASGTAGPPTELIRRHVTDDHICILTFDRPNSAANVFDRAALMELNEHLDYVMCNSNLVGLVLISGKQSIFVAGADLTELSRTRSPEELRDLVELGQVVFTRLASLNVPTVAAIHGACLGGGYEVCLACDFRLASPDKVTKLGLPETQLGILPAWGGSTRLPRLIGLPNALDVILTGQLLAAKPALKRGMIDAIVPREYLLQKACQLIREQGMRLRRRPFNLKRALLNLRPVARLIASRAGKQLFGKTRGQYPAPAKALQVAAQGLARSMEASFALERDAVLELGRSETSRNLMRIFFLQERAKKRNGFDGDLGPADPSPPVRRIAVIGAGVMGAGIAQWASARDISVILRDIHPEALVKGMLGVAQLYDQAVKRHVLTRVEARTGLDRIHPAAMEVPLGLVDIVIEAAVERLDLKQQLFARLDALAGPQTILASNTSALPISEIASATRHPERVVGIHFFNPVHRMQLVEVVIGRQTDPEVVRRAVKFVQQIGKLPVVVQDSPGFLVNRILMPYLVEAGQLFEHGVRPEDLDEAMVEFGMPMGPLRLLDEVGLDVAHHVASDLARHFCDRMEAPQLLSRMSEDGLLGRKGGRGFYLHAEKGRAPVVNPGLKRYAQDGALADLSREDLRTRMVLLMVNEAARCLEEGLVAEAADVDFGMIMGTGFAPFLGGPLRFADSLGLPHVVEEMKRLAGRGELRFTPCKLLQSLAATGRKFYE